MFQKKTLVVKAAFLLLIGAVFVVALVVLERHGDISLIIKRRFKTVALTYDYFVQDGRERGDALFAVLRGERVAPVAHQGQVLSVPVLVYHGIVAKADRFSITQAAFRDQMFALKRAGWQTISTADFEAFLTGKKTLPEKSFLLTFDDGRADSYNGGDPVLKVLDYTAVMYVATKDSLGLLHSRYYIDGGDIQSMLASGRWEIGSHLKQQTGGFVIIDAAGNKGNFLSNKQWFTEKRRLETDAEYEARLHDEIVESQHLLERKLGVGIETMSYPFGDFGEQALNNPQALETIRGLAGAQYKMAFRQVWDKTGEFLANYPGDDMLRLKRIETPTDWSGDRLISYLQRSRGKSLPLSDAFSAGASWQASWGNVQVSNGALQLQAPRVATGAEAFLEGTAAWHDYLFTAQLTLGKGATVSLVSNYRNGENEVLCTFGSGRVSIRQEVDGEVIRLFEGKNPKRVLAEGSELGMRTTSDMTECLVEGVVVAQAKIQQSWGGIGVQIWDPELGNAETTVARVSVVPAELAE